MKNFYKNVYKLNFSAKKSMMFFLVKMKKVDVKWVSYIIKTGNKAVEWYHIKESKLSSLI